LIAAATGHRPHKIGREYDLKGPNTEFIKAAMYNWLDENKPEKIISGMALGVDQIWAICGIRRNIPVIAAIPCANHSSKWPKKSQELYEMILGLRGVSTHFVSSEPYSIFSMQERNRWMVDNSDILVAVWDGSKGGTANCVEYAKEAGKEIFRIDINNLGS
jgi:uncharacterized phage-like protein YoqJ